MSQFSRPTKCVGDGGDIEDLTIKPLNQHSFLVTGFKQLTSCQLSQSEGAARYTIKAGRVQGVKRSWLGTASTAASRTGCPFLDKRNTMVLSVGQKTNTTILPPCL